MKFHIDLGWVVLFAPMSIVAAVFLFEHTPWVAEQTSKGAHHEASVNFDLGRSALKIGNYREAVGQYQTALAIDPEYADAYMGLGIVFNVLGDFEKAINYIQKANTLDSLNEKVAYNNLGMIYAKKKDYKTALEFFRKSLAIDSTVAEVYRNIGEIGFIQKNWAMAVDAYSSAIENKPSLKSLYVNMSQQALVEYKDDEEYKSIKRYFSGAVSEAMLAEFDAEIVDKFTMLSPKLAEDYKSLGRAYAKLRKLEDAIVQYQAALDITPWDAPTHNRIGILYAQSGYLKSALLHFEEAVDLNPDYEDAQINLTRCERKLNRR